MKVVSARFDIPNANKIEVAKAHGAYANLDEILKMPRMDIVDAIDKSGLRGKGGGGGQAHFAQAGGKDAEGLEQAYLKMRELLKL